MDAHYFLKHVVEDIDISLGSLQTASKDLTTHELDAVSGLRNWMLKGQPQDCRNLAFTDKCLSARIEKLDA